MLTDSSRMKERVRARPRGRRLVDASHTPLLGPRLQVGTDACASGPKQASRPRQRADRMTSAAVIAPQGWRMGRSGPRGEEGAREPDAETGAARHAVNGFSVVDRTYRPNLSVADGIAVGAWAREGPFGPCAVCALCSPAGRCGAASGAAGPGETPLHPDDVPSRNESALVPWRDALPSMERRRPSIGHGFLNGGAASRSRSPASFPSHG